MVKPDKAGGEATGKCSRQTSRGEILELAAKEGEVRVDEALRCLLEMGESGEGKLNAETVRASLLAGDMPVPATSIDIAEVSLSSFDELLCGTGVLQ